MDRKDKVTAIKALVEKGEYECAKVVAGDWNMINLLEDMLVTRYEAEKLMLENAKRSLNFYEQEKDAEMVAFWRNAVQGYQHRIDRMTVGEAEEVL